MNRFIHALYILTGRPVPTTATPNTLASSAGLVGAGQTIPGTLLAKGSLRAPDGVSSLSFYIQAQFTAAGPKPGAQWNMFSRGPGLPTIALNPGTVTAIATDGDRVIVKGWALRAGKKVDAEIVLDAPNVSVRLSGAQEYRTAGYPALVEMYSSSLIYRAPQVR